MLCHESCLVKRARLINRLLIVQPQFAQAKLRVDNAFIQNIGIKRVKPEFSANIPGQLCPAIKAALTAQTQRGNAQPAALAFDLITVNKRSGAG